MQNGLETTVGRLLSKAKGRLRPLVAGTAGVVRSAIGRVCHSSKAPSPADKFQEAVDRSRVKLMAEMVIPTIEKLRMRDAIEYTGQSLDGLSQSEKDLFEREVLFSGIQSVSPTQTIQKLSINVVLINEDSDGKTVRVTFEIHTDDGQTISHDADDGQKMLFEFDLARIASRPRPDNVDEHS